MNEVLDRDDLQTKVLSQLHQLWHPRHGAIFIHDLTDDPCRRESRQTGQINRALRLASSLQHATSPRPQREDMARTHQVLRFGLGVDHRENRRGPISRRNARGNPAPRFDRDQWKCAEDVFELGGAELIEGCDAGVETRERGRGFQSSGSVPR